MYASIWNYLGIRQIFLVRQQLVDFQIKKSNFQPKILKFSYLCPNLSTMFGSAPAVRRNLSSVACPLKAARYRGVRPFLSVRFRSTLPCFINLSTASTEPDITARANASVIVTNRLIELLHRRDETISLVQDALIASEKSGNRRH